jgi:uncharacterized protein (TIGR02646 family)
MIEVRRSPVAPPVLVTRGDAERKRLCRAYLRTPAKYDSGQKVFAFDSSIYGHADVKTVLRTAQHDKCAFCESQVTHIAYGDVEHFRPKGGFCQSAAAPLERPGYYWLAYTWDNLFFACQLCNQRHKKNEFPLADPTKRARCHRDDVTVERPHFIDPSSGEDPAASLSFRDEVPFHKNNRGKETIRALGLKRAPLQEKRKERLDALRMVFVVAYTLDPITAGLKHQDVQDARDLLRRAVSDAGEYAAMVRAAIPRWEKRYGVQMV